MDASEPTPRWPDTPEAFCAALKAARLRRGLTLAEISQQTKIIESHFVALERADLRHWPKGIFRRAFFSDYVRAIGLPVEPTVAAFTRLFPEPAAVAEEPVAEPLVRPAQHKARALAGELRLALAGGPSIPPGAASRARLAAADAALVIAAAVFGARLVDADLAATIAIVALSYYSLAVILGRPHVGPTLITRAVRSLPGLRRPRPERALPTMPVLRRASTALLPVITGGARWLTTRLANLPAAFRWAERWRTIDLGRVTAIDLQRLKDATPRVLDRLKRGRNGDRTERPMPRPRLDSPRHMRRRPDQSGDAGVRVRIRLTRRDS